MYCQLVKWGDDMKSKGHYRINKFYEHTRIGKVFTRQLHELEDTVILFSKIQMNKYSINKFLHFWEKRNIDMFLMSVLPEINMNVWMAQFISEKGKYQSYRLILPLRVCWKINISKEGGGCWRIILWVQTQSKILFWACSVMYREPLHCFHKW